MTRYGIATILLTSLTMLHASDAHANYCNYSSSEDQCPDTSRSYHTLIITDIWGTAVSVTGADNYKLGTWSGVLIACNTSTNLIYFLKDTFDNSYPSSLQADSALCMGAGNDVVTVEPSSFTCGGQSTGAFAYGSNRILHLHGQGGNDYLYGASGREKLCGGSGGDTLDGAGGTDELDGSSGADIMNGGAGGGDESWGYTGADCMYDPTGADDYLNGEGDFDGCVWDDDNDFDAVICGSSASGGNSPNGGAGVSNCDPVTDGECLTECPYF